METFSILVYFCDQCPSEAFLPSFTPVLKNVLIEWQIILKKKKIKKLILCIIDLISISKFLDFIFHICITNIFKIVSITTISLSILSVVNYKKPSPCHIRSWIINDSSHRSKRSFAGIRID